MKSRYVIWMLVTHAVLLLLASTRFSLLSIVWGEIAWTWDYFQYSHRSGWGVEYLSDFSLVVVLTYLAAFLLGAISYLIAGARNATVWSGLALVLCVVGLISFLIEGSHWLWNHNFSWIAICPAASLVLAVVVAVQLGRAAKPSEAPESPAMCPTR